MKKNLLLLLSLVMALAAYAQWPMPKEGWVTVPNSAPNDYGVYLFRKDVKLAVINKPLRVLVSGDNRYKLFVNGTIASIGPARSDLQHWNCEEVDLAPFLHQGDNVIAAVVWNAGSDRPVADMTYRTAFLITAVDSSANVFKTDNQWLCRQDNGYSPVAVRVPGYYAAGPGERVDMHRQISDFNDLGADLSQWEHAKIIAGVNRVGQSGAYGTYPGWMIRESPLPQRELSLQRIPNLHLPLTIPANSKRQVILDNKTLTNAYLTLLISQGENSKIAVGYAEALYGKNFVKGNRNDIKDKQFYGRTDTVISNGKENQQFTSLSWRTYRYIVLNITTGSSPLTINDIYGTFTGFPFKLQASLDTKDKQLLQIFNTGWHTARLCAIETYMDCPYYEQLQYFGDARIQALVSLYMTGDDRLVKNYFDMADWSRNAEGVTQSRYPSSLAQWIQPYALHYIYALHDYMMYGGDMDFLKDKLMSERTIIDYFRHYLTADGRVKDLPGWNFTDWVDHRDGWEDGVAMPGNDGCNSVMDLQLLYAYQMAADLERNIGMKSLADLYTQYANSLKRTIRKKYWRQNDGLFSDIANGERFSQHANALAILTGVTEGEEATAMAEKIEKDSTLAPASIYFKFYTHQAMTKAGLGNNYLSWLGKWRENLKLGLTTWAETSDVASARSDCHAWGASPNVEFFRTVLGIESAAPQFREVVITPHLGDIKAIGGKMPTPNGMIEVNYQRKGDKLNATVALPEYTHGTFVWKSKHITLKEGKSNINL